MRFMRLFIETESPAYKTT